MSTYNLRLASVWNGGVCCPVTIYHYVTSSSTTLIPKACGRLCKCGAYGDGRRIWRPCGAIVIVPVPCPCIEVHQVTTCGCLASDSLAFCRNRALVAYGTCSGFLFLILAGSGLRNTTASPRLCELSPCGVVRWGWGPCAATTYFTAVGPS